ncbi:hypothetical protein ACM26W_14290 [Halomonas sp. HK25]|uniref:hypothetical protein n=1 Tax=Halomonas sp. HK25 TaxID=3394321 RepID=UPI0039FCE739
MSTIYLHIGANKTGSSAIQAFLNSNRDVLDGYGFHVLDNVYDNAHYPLSYALGCGPKLNDINEQDELKKTLDEIEKNKDKKIIISSEYFILENDPGKIAKYFSGHDVKVIVYLRRHDLWLESLYNQAVKTAPGIPWEVGIYSYINYIKSNKKQEISFKRLLMKWDRVFGKNNILVRPYERDGFLDGSIVSDFSISVGAPIIDSDKGVGGVVNKSIPVQYVPIVEVIKKVGRVNQRDLSKLVNWTLTRDPDPRFALLNDDQRTLIISEYIEEYEFIASRYKAKNFQFFSDFSSGYGKKEVPRVNLLQSLKVLGELAGSI